MDIPGIEYLRCPKAFGYSSNAHRTSAVTLQKRLTRSFSKVSEDYLSLNAAGRSGLCNFTTLVAVRLRIWLRNINLCNICCYEVARQAHHRNIRKWELVHERTLELILSPPLNKRCVRPRSRMAVEGNRNCRLIISWWRFGYRRRSLALLWSANRSPSRCMLRPDRIKRSTTGCTLKLRSSKSYFSNGASPRCRKIQRGVEELSDGIEAQGYKE